MNKLFDWIVKLEFPFFFDDWIWVSPRLKIPILWRIKTIRNGKEVVVNWRIASRGGIQ